MSHLVVLTGGFVRKNPNSPASPTEVLGGHFILDVASGGTGGANNTAALNRLFGAVTKGQFAVFNGTNVGLFSPGPNGRYLQSDNTQPFGYRWSSPAGGGGGGAPAAHAASHQHSGSDEIATATAAANAIPKAGSTGQLNVNWLPTMLLASPGGGGLRGLMRSPALSDRLKVFRGSGYASPDHAWLLNGGTNTHAQIDSHLAATSNIHGAVGALVDTSSVQELRNKRLVGTLFVRGSPDDTANFLIRSSPSSSQQFLRFAKLASVSTFGSPFQGLAISIGGGPGSEWARQARISATSTGNTADDPKDLLLQPAGNGFVRVAQGTDSTLGRFRPVVVGNDFVYRTVERCSPSQNLTAQSHRPEVLQTQWNGNAASAANDGALRFSERDRVTYMYTYNSGSGTQRILSTEPWLLHAWSVSRTADQYFAFGYYGGSPDMFTDTYGFVFPYATTVTEMIAWRKSPTESPVLQLRVNGASVSTITFLPGQTVRTTGTIYQNVAANTPIQVYSATRGFGPGHVHLVVRRRYSP